MILLILISMPAALAPRFSRASGSRGTNHRLQASRSSGGGTPTDFSR